jgi:hypothetical protein
MVKQQIAAALLVSASTLAFGHGGGLNAEGCHINRKTGDYHCHRAVPAPQSAALSKARPDPVTMAKPRVQSRTGSPSEKRAGIADEPRSASTQPAQRTAAGGQTCYVGPRGGTYTITKRGKKNYKGC